jgi:OmpA family protein/PEGA domain-containing protein
MRLTKFLGYVSFFGLFMIAVAIPGFTQSKPKPGHLKIDVRPEQAYIFVDGNAIADGSQTIRLEPGTHSVEIRNYGYVPQIQNVEITSGGTTKLDITLQASGDPVTGPFGDIELKGHPRAAVLLNGKTPPYFVGHVDEFDNNWIWHQWLLVKPGSYDVTVTEKGQTIWSGPVAVGAGQRMIVDLNHNGEIKSKDFKQGLALGPQPRFHAGVASAVVPIAPVTASLSASQTQTMCGQPVTLNWNSTDAAETSISSTGDVEASGDHTVIPTQTTTYELVAKGPGGEAKQTATVEVDTQPRATLALSKSEVTYHKIGDTVVEQDATTLNWSASNADSVAIEPLGSVANSGSETIEATPEGSETGPIDRDVTYTLNATNTCGGTASQTATLHFGGSIDPAPPVTLASVFYPTDYPQRRHPQVGLVSSQQQVLANAAATFKNNEQYDHNNKLVVVGHADVRGSKTYNLALSELRAELVKNYLLSQGIEAEKVETRVEGKERQLDQQQVEELQSQDSQKPQKWMESRNKATWLAYNRRVDIILEPSGQESTEAYPNDAPDARVLWQRPVPSLGTVETATGIKGNPTIASRQ